MSYLKVPGLTRVLNALTLFGVQVTPYRMMREYDILSPCTNYIISFLLMRPTDNSIIITDIYTIIAPYNRISLRTILYSTECERLPHVIFLTVASGQHSCNEEAKTSPV